MISKYQKKIKINKPLKNFSSGNIVIIKTDSSGQPIEKYWRKRFQDAKKDNCLEEIIEDKKIKIINTENKKTNKNKGD